MKRNKVDTLLYTLGIWGFLIASGYLIFSKDGPIIRKTDRSSLGQVKPIGKDVRLRAESAADWNSVARLSDVYLNDRVFTGKNSTAEIHLKNRQTFIVEPNSLVKISDEQETALFDLQDGSFFAEIKKGARFFVKNKNKKTEIKAEQASLRIETKGDEIKLVVLKGEAAAITAEGKKPVVVKANEEAVLKEEKVEMVPLKIALLTPASREVHFSNGSPTRLSWRTSVPTSVTVKVAKDRDFQDVVFNQVTEQNSLEVELPSQQSYFWKVETIDNGTLVSSSSSFSVYPLSPPILKEAVINEKQMSFEWEDLSLSSAYALQISKTSDFETLEKAISVEELSLTMSTLPVGRYYWRVLSLHRERLDLISNVSGFTIRPREIILPLAKAEPVLAPPPPNKKTSVKKDKPLVHNRIIRDVKRQLAWSPPLNQGFSSSFKVWGGLGMNYLSFYQSGSGDLDSGTFSKMSLPTYAFGLYGHVADGSALDFQYQQWPGGINKGSANINTTNYTIKQMSAEYEGRVFAKEDSSAWLTLGYQIEQLPFLTVDSLNNTGLYENELQGVTLGGRYFYKSKSKLEYETSLRYYLITGSRNLNGQTFSAKAGNLVDGTLGISRRFDSGLRFGAYWLLQYQNFKYDFNMDGVSSSGTQTFTDSNVQLRIGYDFYGLILIPILCGFNRRRRRGSF